MDCKKEDMATVRKHWSQSVVFTDTSYPDRVEKCESRIGELWLTWYPEWAQELTADKLLPGEISAAIFQVGCYTVRSAQRVFQILDSGYRPDEEPPASQQEIELVRKNGGTIPFSHMDELCIVHEISARHNSNPQGSFVYICRASHARNYSWSESIESVYTAKENKAIPDEYASLLVHCTYVGSSFSSDTWHKLDPTGKISALELHPFNSDIDNARFN